jgi:hypothetical protein
VIMMTLDQARARTRAATVQLPTKGGQGVLVPGGFVLTAAHCIDWSLDGGMALGREHGPKRRCGVRGVQARR